MSNNRVKHIKSAAVDELAQKRVVMALDKFLVETSLEAQLQFFHRLKVRFTLSTTDKGLYVCRVFKQHNQGGQVVTIEDYVQGGKTPHAALTNAIAEFLACSYGDYHDYMNLNWAGHGPEYEQALEAELERHRASISVDAGSSPAKGAN